jgi:hypothetical protein
VTKLTSISSSITFRLEVPARGNATIDLAGSDTTADLR